MNLKKPLILIGCTLMLLKCNNEPVKLPENDSAKANETSLAEATQIALHYSSWHESGPASTGLRRVDEPMTFADENRSPLFYAFNFMDNDGGFIIVSGDKRAIPVLAFGESGNPVDWENAHKINGLKLWLNISKEKMKRIKAMETEADSHIVDVWKKYSTVPSQEGINQRQHSEPPSGCSPSNCVGYSNVWGRLLTTEWRQSGVTNASTPPDGDCECDREPAGCGPVAMGQVLRYHAPNNWFNYAAMPASSFSCGASTIGELDLASLMVACAAATTSVYGFAGCNTATLPTEIPDGLEMMGLSNGGTVRNIAVDGIYGLANEMSSGNPVIMYGYDNIFTEWHIWVCEGIRIDWLKSCNGYQCVAYRYVKEFLNWGWGPGAGNGWYMSGDYSPGSSDFDGGLKMISGIRR